MQGGSSYYIRSTQWVQNCSCLTVQPRIVELICTDSCDRLVRKTKTYTSSQHGDVRVGARWIASWLLPESNKTLLLFEKPFGRTARCIVLWSGNLNFSSPLFTRPVSLSALKVNKLLRGPGWTEGLDSSQSFFVLYFLSAFSRRCRHIALLDCIVTSPTGSC